jgi:hypothetical protein
MFVFGSTGVPVFEDVGAMSERISTNSRRITKSHARESDTSGYNKAQIIGVFEGGIGRREAAGMKNT